MVSDEEMYTTRYLVDLILDGHWTLSEVTTATIWRVFERFGQAGRENLYLVEPCGRDPSSEEVRAFEDILLTVEQEMLRRETARLEEIRDRTQMKFPWAMKSKKDRQQVE